MSYIPPSDSVKILNATGTTINPATEETLQLLRRMVKLLEPLATVDSSNRQRISLDSSIATVTVSNATASLLNANVNILLNGNVDPRYQMIDIARTAYATGVRANLKFT